jgi:hypothetical protein
VAFSSFYDYRNLRFPSDLQLWPWGELSAEPVFRRPYHSILHEAQFRLAASQSSSRSCRQQADQEVYTD